MQADQMSQRRIPRALQYGAIQQMLFVMGIMLAMGVLTESGVLGDIGDWIIHFLDGRLWVMAFLSGLLSSFVDTFTVAITNISLYPVIESEQLRLWADSDYMANFTQNGSYWMVMAYATASGGCLLSVGSTSGLALMKMEHMRLGWYIKNLTPKILAGVVAGFVILWIETLCV